MRRTVSARLGLDVLGTSDLVLGIAVAAGPTLVEERLDVAVAGRDVQVRELADRHGTRWHRLTVTDSVVEVAYDAVVDGIAPPPAVDETDLLRYLRPSRYCEADTLGGLVAAEIGSPSGRDALDAVTDWTARMLTYVPGSSGPTDGALATLAGREGVCRDYAHVVIALLRALEVPARLAAVYAPGLSPMDFHAVAEAYVDGDWYVVDATHKAPRSSLLRIATGTDATETSFLTSIGGSVTLHTLGVVAVVDDLPFDLNGSLVSLR